MKLVIGSRGSQLALWQSEWARDRLLEAHPSLDVSIEVIRTEGDRNLAASFTEIGGKGLFTKEVDEALLAGTTHLSVHSLKDLPTQLTEGLALTAVSPREDVRDALVSREGAALADLPEGASVGTSSLRRRALLRAERPDLDIRPLRGNVDTRLKKLSDEGLDAIVLAGAGLKRLGLARHITELLDPARFVPAPGQGVMAVVTRADDAETGDLVSVLEDADARAASTAERAALAELGGGCRIPFGAWGRKEGGRLVVDGVVAHPETGGPIRRRVEGAPEAAEALGRELAEGLVAAGGRAILDEVTA